MRPAALAAAVLMASCTASDRGIPPAPGPTDATPAPMPSPPAVILPVVAPEGSPAVDGMRLGAEQAHMGLDVRDPDDDPTTAVREVAAAGPPAIIVVDAPGAVVAARSDLETAGVPVVAVGGDLYSDRQLFRYAFQTAIPLRWQARVLAHHLVGDRRHARIAAVGRSDLTAAALAEEGVAPAEDIEGADAVLALAGGHPGPPGPQLAVPHGALSSAAPFPAGTVACGPYTWAGWAEPIPRVARFRRAFADRFGREPGLPEQEGYEAVRALGDALAMAGGRGGDALVRALERFRDQTYSSTPIRLGPDDHVFAEESHLGLYALAPPGERAPGEDLEPVPWRPLMRTFTTDGKRVNLAERDVRVFFPNWRPMRPRPNYWRSEFGIVTRPGEDPLY
jgi:Periplasmic binding protein